MLYLSKGIAEKDSTENLIKVRRGDYTYTVSGNAAKLWLEYALSPECVELGAKNGSYQNLVIDNATQPSQVSKHKLNPDNVMDYDFENAKEHTTAYVQEIMGIIGGTDSRFER